VELACNAPAVTQFALRITYKLAFQDQATGGGDMARPRTAARQGEGADQFEAVSQLADVTDRMHAMLVRRADALMVCTDKSPGKAELAALVDVIESYERQRWPTGKISGGKG
jgi:hypothetical protein